MAIGTIIRPDFARLCHEFIETFQVSSAVEAWGILDTLMVCTPVQANYVQISSSGQLWELTEEYFEALAVLDSLVVRSV